MTFSALISRTVPHHDKYSSRQGSPIVRLIQHHHAATGLAGVERLTDPNAQASATYIVLTSGEILGQVPEEFRPWTSSSFEADGGAITIEVQNVGAQVNGNDDDPSSWKISDAALNSCIKLLADVAKRYNWGGISEGNYQGHRQWFQTACPGGYIWARMSQIRATAQALYSKGTVAVSATPPVAGKSVWQLADEVMAGLHGSGDARKASLGGNYAAVQAEVNRRSGVGPVASKPKTVAQLADETIAGAHGSGDARKKSLGAQYDAVQAEVNRRLGGGGVAPKGLNISQLADAVLRGAYGNGADRQKRLGANFQAVQNEINRRMGAVPKGPTISQLADAVLRGEYGNGADRQKRLGANYQAVQNEINRRVK